MLVNRTTSLPASVRTGIAIAAFASLLCEVVDADVFVLANRTRQTLDIRVSPEAKQPYSVRLASGQVRPLYSDSRLHIAFRGDTRRGGYDLDANSAYFFGVSSRGAIGLRRIGLGGDETTAQGRPLEGDPSLSAVATINVALYVDEEEPLRRPLWEKKLRDRVAAASERLELFAGVRLRVVDVDVWQSSNDKTKFEETLAEFEKRINPSPARLAIGFTSQYELPRGRTHLGGIRGPLGTHILLREWSARVSERERLELLLHELGHFLGATHSPEPNSVMRPVLGDRKSRRKDFVIQFDPVNALVIAMVGEEIRRNGVQRFSQLSRGSKVRLRQIYGALGQTMPDDSSTKRFKTLTSVGRGPQLADHTRRVLQAVVTAASRNVRLVESKQSTGDALTELYVRAAAGAAAGLPRDVSAKAFLVGLGIAMDDTMSLRKLPITKSLVSATEPVGMRSVRLGLIGKPTLEGRRDLAKHFFVAGLLTAMSDAKQADKLGINKETLDASGGTGFSFADIAANRAGIQFAESVLAGRLSLKLLASDFRMLLYMPSIKDLPEGLSSEELINQYGGPGDERFDALLTEIDQRIKNLPPYRILEIKF